MNFPCSSPVSESLFGLSQSHPLGRHLKTAFDTAGPCRRTQNLKHVSSAPSLPHPGRSLSESSGDSVPLSCWQHGGPPAGLVATGLWLPVLLAQ